MNKRRKKKQRGEEKRRRGEKTYIKNESVAG